MPWSDITSFLDLYRNKINSRWSCGVMNISLNVVGEERTNTLSYLLQCELRQSSKPWKKAVKAVIGRLLPFPSIFYSILECQGALSFCFNEVFKSLTDLQSKSSRMPGHLCSVPTFFSLSLSVMTLFLCISAILLWRIEPLFLHGQGLHHFVGFLYRKIVCTPKTLLKRSTDVD